MQQNAVCVLRSQEGREKKQEIIERQGSEEGKRGGMKLRLDSISLLMATYLTVVTYSLIGRRDFCRAKFTQGPRDTIRLMHDKYVEQMAKLN